MPLLRSIAPAEIPSSRSATPDPATVAAAAAIVGDVRDRGEAALRAHAERLGDLEPGAPLLLPRATLLEALGRLPASDRAVLERAASRIEAFARAQRAALQDGSNPVPGGVAGWAFEPVDAAGCYAPGGRYPLPSSVLMTAVTARAAGVGTVIVASPRPGDVTLAAAAIAGADAVLTVGGAQAIAALACGAGPIPACDAVVGPGNRWVTAAKQLIAGQVRIDMLAGPSELLVVADSSADPELLAADLLAQAEHDPDAVPMLLALDPALPGRVEAALQQQLANLPTADITRKALANGFAVVTTLQRAPALCDRIAPEHLALHLADSEAFAQEVRHHGACFIGEGAAEVLADYGAGPNHTLPTGGTARSEGGLSVLSFLKCRTWLRIDDRRAASVLARDAAQLARLEGLEGHARAADRRRPSEDQPPR